MPHLPYVSELSNKRCINVPKRLGYIYKNVCLSASCKLHKETLMAGLSQGRLWYHAWTYNSCIGCMVCLTGRLYYVHTFLWIKNMISKNYYSKYLAPNCNTIIEEKQTKCLFCTLHALPNNKVRWQLWYVLLSSNWIHECMCTRLMSL